MGVCDVTRLNLGLNLGLHLGLSMKWLMTLDDTVIVLVAEMEIRIE